MKKIKIESDETLLHNKWLSLKKLTYREGNGEEESYIYSEETRCRGNIVAFLPFRYLDNGDVEVLVRDEFTPPWGTEETYLSSFTGGVEEGETVRNMARIELEEETGYIIEESSRAFGLGTCKGNKSSNTNYYLYGFDVTGLKQGRVKTDGSKNEARAKNIWFNISDNQERNHYLLSQAVDPLLFVILMRLEAWVIKK